MSGKTQQSNGEVEELDQLAEKQQKIAELEDQLAAKDQQIQSLTAQLETSQAYERHYSRRSAELEKTLLEASPGQQG